MGAREEEAKSVGIAALVSKDEALAKLVGKARRLFDAHTKWSRLRTRNARLLPKAFFNPCFFPFLRNYRRTHITHREQSRPRE
jgi:hypothetical protein